MQLDRGGRYHCVYRCSFRHQSSRHRARSRTNSVEPNRYDGRHAHTRVGICKPGSESIFSRIGLAHQYALRGGGSVRVCRKSFLGCERTVYPYRGAKQSFSWCCRTNIFLTPFVLALPWVLASLEEPSVTQTELLRRMQEQKDAPMGMVDTDAKSRVGERPVYTQCKIKFPGSPDDRDRRKSFVMWSAHPCHADPAH